MNSTQVLREALPDLPPQRIDDRPPRSHPGLSVREKMEPAGPMYQCILPNGPKHCGFMYPPWFVEFGALSLISMFVLVGSRWSEFWADTLQYYNLTSKTGSDLIEFFAIFTVLGAVHEVAHGLSCTHFGGISQ